VPRRTARCCACAARRRSGERSARRGRASPDGGLLAPPELLLTLGRGPHALGEALDFVGLGSVIAQRRPDPRLRHVQIGGRFRDPSSTRPAACR
jgi:hypothetical protein